MKSGLSNLTVQPIPLSSGLETASVSWPTMTCPLLEAEDALRLQPERGDAELPARLHQAVPEVLSVLGWKVHLPSALSDEADPQQQGGDAGHLRLARPHVAEAPGGEIGVRQLRQRLPGAGAGDVYRRVRGGDVGAGDAHLRAPPSTT